MFESTERREIPFLDLLSWVFGNSGYDHDKPLFIDPAETSNSISHNQAKSTVKKLIAGLHVHGLRPGDSVCVHSYNNINYSLIYLAIIGAGGRFVGCNPAFTIYEIKDILRLFEVKFVIVEPGLLKNMIPPVDELSIPRARIFMFDSESVNFDIEFQSWSSLLLHGSEDWITFDDEQKSKTTIAALLATSGTTGLPKAAEMSHFALVAQSIVLLDSKDKTYEVRRLLCLPQFHAFGGPLGHFDPLRQGYETYIMRRYHAESFVTYLEEHKITETALVNPILADLLRLHGQERKLLSSLRLAWIAGAPLGASLQNQLAAILHEDATLSQVWGMTEVGWITSFQYPEKDDTGSVGRLLPNVQARVANSDLQDIKADGLWGEILIRSPCMMTSYLNNPETTKSVIDNGWLRTGDIGYQEKGKWYIIDRIKEIIKVRGWQVSPTEIEACLLTHPAIIDVAVIGIDLCDGNGELPRAYVVIDPAMADQVNDAEIQNHLNGRLAKYKALAGGVKRIKTIPRSAAGKIMKKILRDQAKEEIAESLKIGRLAISVLETSAEDIEVASENNDNSAEGVDVLQVVKDKEGQNI